MSQDTIRMLSIDDRTVTTELDRAGYRKIGVTIRSATTFAEAQSILASGPIDIIVINLDYGKVDSVSACQHFKTQEETKNIPIVATSVQDKPRTLKGCMNAGVDLFVEQPMPRQYFIEKIRSLLDQKTRETDRVTHNGQVVFVMDGKRHTCGIGDLSQSGILLTTDLELKPGVVIEMEFDIPGYKKPIAVSGEVVRKITQRDRGALGFGVRFCDFQGDSQKRLEKYILKSQNHDPKLAYYL